MWWLLTLAAIATGSIYSYWRGWISTRGTQLAFFAMTAVTSLRQLVTHSDRSLPFVVALASFVFAVTLMVVVIMRVQRQQS